MGVGHQPPSRDAITRAGLRLAAVIVVAAVAGALAVGCPSPRLPAVEGCRMNATRCRDGRPEVCSSSGRFHAVGDLTCAAVNAVCVEGADGGVAHCAPVDGGAP